MYSSRTAWKLVPPKPKALTPAVRGWSLAVDPGPGLGVEEERAALEIALGVGLLDQGRRQHLVVQGQRGLDQAGHAGGALGVPDHAT